MVQCIYETKRRLYFCTYFSFPIFDFSDKTHLYHEASRKQRLQEINVIYTLRGYHKVIVICPVNGMNMGENELTTLFEVSRIHFEYMLTNLIIFYITFYSTCAVHANFTYSFVLLRHCGGIFISDSFNNTRLVLSFLFEANVCYQSRIDNPRC